LLWTHRNLHRRIRHAGSAMSLASSPATSTPKAA
jgi:hypothetical protein